MPTTISPASERLSSATAADSRLEIDATRARQTERQAAPFRDVLAGGVSVLMSGAEVATHVMAGPVMAAAVHDARVGAVGADLRRPAPGRLRARIERAAAPSGARRRGRRPARPT